MLNNNDRQQELSFTNSLLSLNPLVDSRNSQLAPLPSLSSSSTDRQGEGMGSPATFVHISVGVAVVCGFGPCLRLSRMALCQIGLMR
jgi:hypothetical protein